MRHARTSLVLLLAVIGGLLLAVGGRSPATDPLSRELSRFRTLTDEQERVQAIRKFGPVRDPRVTVVLSETVQDELDRKYAGAGYSETVLLVAAVDLFNHHIPEAERVCGTKYWTAAAHWWKVHEGEVRQRAASRP